MGRAGFICWKVSCADLQPGFLKRVMRWLMLDVPMTLLTGDCDTNTGSDWWHGTSAREQMYILKF